jgi:hypothetical protein
MTKSLNPLQKKMSRQQRADLRCCASCEFVFSKKEYFNADSCPICKYATYGARFIYKNKAYEYKKTQKPFYDRLISYSTERAIAEGDALIIRAKNYRRKAFMQILQI